MLQLVKSYQMVTVYMDTLFLVSQSNIVVCFKTMLNSCWSAVEMLRATTVENHFHILVSATPVLATFLCSNFLLLVLYIS